MRIIKVLLLLTITLNSFGQYPFEKYPAPKYKTYKGWKTYDKSKKENKIEFVLTIPKFFNKKDNLKVLLTSFPGTSDSSYITIFKNGKQLQRFFEPMFFSDINIIEPIRLADINGDNLLDLKLVIPYMGLGIAALNNRVIYLFQGQDAGFTKTSFLDMMNENRKERDFDGDGNYEIITMTLVEHQSHNYFMFNLFNFKNNNLINVNNKFDYPILIQLLHRKNYTITNKISRKKMKDFELDKPEDYDKK